MAGPPFRPNAVKLDLFAGSVQPGSPYPETEPRPWPQRKAAAQASSPESGALG